ncbi:MAG: membrane protein of unknown function [Candidatus Thorarchaeota archaeon]|nr:MAG: membrane protein of unknown function [Candidatus Thorarchaeota archaeon]
MDLGLFFVGIGLTIGFALIALVFIIQERRTGRKIYFLKEATLLGIPAGIANIMLAGPEFDIFNLGSILIPRVTLTIWVFVFGLFGLFFIGTRHESPDWKIASAVVTIGIVSILCGFIGWAVYDSTNVVIVDFIWHASFGLFAALIFGYGSKVYFDANRRLPEIRSLVLAIALMIVTVAYILGIVVYDVPILFSEIPIGGENIAIVLDFVRISMMISIAITLGSDFEYVYRLPINIYDIQVNSTAGMNLYHYGEMDRRRDPNLFAGALSAISLIVQEVSDSEAPLTRVISEDRSIMVTTREEHGIVATAIVERSSLFLKRSLEVFADMFIEKYGTVLESSGYSSSEYDASLLVYIAFPYLKM